MKQIDPMEKVCGITNLQWEVILQGLYWGSIASFFAFFTSLFSTAAAYSDEYGSQPPFNMWTVVVLPCTLGTFLLFFGLIILYYWWFPERNPLAPTTRTVAANYIQIKITP